MQKFNLNQYKTSNPYFTLFDVYFRDINANKETLLKEMGIAPSSYRKCRRGELHISEKIIEQISLYFHLKSCSEEIINELNDLTNNIYYDMYYKIEDSLEYYNSRLQTLKEEHYIIFPIIDILILFLKMNSTTDSNIVRNNNAELFEHVKKYNKFYEFGLTDLYEIICLFYDDDIPGNLWIKNYNNACAYHVLASRSHRNKRYIESLFFGNKAKEFLNEDGNIKRLLYINNITMSNLIYVGNFEACYDLSFKQLLVLRSIALNDPFMIRSARKFKTISMLALKYYNDIIEEYKLSTSLTVIEAICVMVSHYVIALNTNDYSQYNNLYNDIINSNFSKDDVLLIMSLNDYLSTKGKVSLNLAGLKNYEIIIHLEQIIKNIEIH